MKTKNSRLTRSVLSEQFSALVIDLLVPQTKVADGPGDTRTRLRALACAGLTAITQCYDTPSASAGFCGHGASAPSNTDCRLSGASRDAGRSLRNPLASLSSALDDSLTNRRGALDRPLHCALYGSARRLC